MFRFIKQLVYYIWAKFLFGKKCKFDSSSYVSAKSSFEGFNKIYPNCVFTGKMGYGSYLGPNCQISAHIGRFTSIAPFVRTNSGIHPFEAPFVTTCPMFFSTKKQNGHAFADKMMFEERKGYVSIGNDCWIGENVFIAGGHTIGDGAVILAGAVVVNDVPPYAIVGGVPAKVVKYRYDKETIEYLLRIKWWERDVDWLKANWQLLCNIDNLKEVIK